MSNFSLEQLDELELTELLFEVEKELNGNKARGCHDCHKVI